MENSDPYGELRKKMVAGQLIPRGISDRNVIAAMLAVERHLFVPEDMKQYAYRDEALPLGGGQTISQPYIVAVMTELLRVKRSDKILEIGTGSGYQAAVLSLLCKNVYSIEQDPGLAASASKLLIGLGFKNISIKAGDGYSGWAEFAPYDKIIFTCAPPDVPEKLVGQLKEGGLITGPVGPAGFTQELILGTKTGGRLDIESVMAVSFVPMVKGDEDN